MMGSAGLVPGHDRLPPVVCMIRGVMLLSVQQSRTRSSIDTSSRSHRCLRFDDPDSRLNSCSFSAKDSLPQGAMLQVDGSTTQEKRFHEKALGLASILLCTTFGGDEALSVGLHHL